MALIALLNQTVAQRGMELVWVDRWERFLNER